MAAGGQGAPLVPYLDQLLAKKHFASTGRLAVFLNIGGISNIFTVDHKTGIVYNYTMYVCMYVHVRMHVYMYIFMYVTMYVCILCRFIHWV